MNEVVDLEAARKRRDAALGKADLITEESNPKVAAEAVEELKQVVKDQDDVVQMLVHDLGILAKKVMQLEAIQMNTASTVSVVATALIEKNVVSEAEFQTLWQRDIIPQLKKAGLVPDQSQSPAQNIVVPKNKILVP